MDRIAETQRNHHHDDDDDDGAAAAATTNTATDAPQGVSAQERLRQYNQQRRRPTTTTVASRQEVRRTLFRAYWMVSIVLALLAILADDHQRVLSNHNGVVSSTMRYGVPVNKRRKRKRRRKDILWPSFGKKRSTRRQQQQQQQRDKERHSSTTSTPQEYYYGQQRDEQQQQQQQPGWVRWISRKFRQPFEPVMPLPPPAPWWLRWVDPNVLQSPPPSFLLSLLIAKVTSSGWRLLVVSNLTMLLVWLAQKHVARAFLGNNGTLTTDGGASDTTAGTTTTDSHKVDGYWVVQALMPLTVAAAVVPAEFILLWFMTLLFCHFLHCKAGSSVVHTAHSGQTPVPGAFRLLLVVLVASALTLAALVRCFAGWYESDDDVAAMVWLFGTDWIVLATNSMKHLLHHSLQTLEHYQLSRVADIQEAKSILEKRREEMEHAEQQDQQHTNEESVLVWDESDRSMFANDDDIKSPFIDDDDDDDDCNDKDKTRDTGHLTTGSLQYCQPIRFPEPSQILDREYRMLDRRLETMESLHALRVGLLDSTMFGLELLTGVARVGHFVHIWYLHGFFAVDVAGGVLALHLHSHVSNILQKIGERANTNRIARDIDAMFKDATDSDIRESSSDCCCVCLGTMRSTRGVKKVSCGHMFHTHCLREIMERSKSVEAAKCPLCRAPVLSGPCQPPPRNLYRFTTAGVVPAWLPIFSDVSFVVMRNNHGNNDGEPLPRDGPTATREESSWRRLRTLFFGAATLSPQQEQEALSQLVDMFPQYAREDLLRELRLRRSADGVVESILLGVFVGASTARDYATTGPSNEINNDDDSSPPASTTVPSVPAATSTQDRSTRQADSIRTRVPNTHNSSNRTTIGASLVSNDDDNNGTTTNGTPSPRPSFGSPPMIQRIVSPLDASDMMDQILGETPRTTPASVCTSLPTVDRSTLLSPGFDVSISRIVEEDDDDDCVDEDAPIENNDKQEQIVVEDVLSDDDDDVLYSPAQSVGKLHKTEKDVSLSRKQDKTVVMEETADANETNNDTNDRDKSLADDQQEEQNEDDYNDEGSDNDDDSSDANDSTMFTVQRGQGETYQYIFPEADQTPIPPAPRRLFRTPRQG